MLCDVCDSLVQPLPEAPVLTEIVGFPPTAHSTRIISPAATFAGIVTATEVPVAEVIADDPIGSAGSPLIVGPSGACSPPS